MFPTGAYAHSFGMEGAVQDGLINDEADFRAFIHDMIIPGLEKLELPTAAGGVRGGAGRRLGQALRA